MQEKGLTLTELLLVIAIFTILIAAIIPSFTDADIAAQVAQARSDMRSIGTALEAYRRDYPRYPPDHQYYQGQIEPYPLLRMLTTPMAYIPSLPDEVFPTSSTLASTQYLYKAKEWISIVGVPADYPNKSTDRWALVSNGPDGYVNSGQYLLFGEDALNKIAAFPAWQIGPGCLYDPTNGTVSAGDIVLLHEGMLSTTSAPHWQSYK